MKEPIVSPSLLAADFNNLSHDLLRMKNEGIKYLHFDVMDGHLVDNISFGAPILASLKPHYEFIMDVHLMIEQPGRFISQFVKSGANIITFHLEALRSEAEVRSLITEVKSHNVKVGLSVKPKTEINALLPYIKDIDLVLVMSVEPGWGGQPFLDSAIDKIVQLRNYIDDNNLSCLISVDGGINDVTGRKCLIAGADILVAGSYLFNKADLHERINNLKGK